MDEKVSAAINKYPDYARLKEEFSLDFLVECLTNSRRGIMGTARIIGRILSDHGKDPTLFVASVHYHELVERKEKRNLGYSDNQLGDRSTNNPDYERTDLVSKRKELDFLQYVAKEVMDKDIPWLAITIAQFAPMFDYEIPAMPFNRFYWAVRNRIEHGIPEYQDPLRIQDLKNAIELFKMGGDTCSGTNYAIDIAHSFISREIPRHPSLFDLD